MTRRTHTLVVLHLFFLTLTTALEPTRLVYQFPYPQVKSYLENLAVRGNGNVLLTNLAPPNLYMIDPHAPKPTPSLVHFFDTVLDLTGITETSPDTFFVAVQNETAGTFRAAPGSTAIYRVCFDPPGSSSADVALLGSVTSAAFLNGLTTFDHRTILAADSRNGTVVAIDTITGANRVVVSDPLMGVPAGARFPLGINGIKFVLGELFFTNSARNIFAKVPLKRDATAAGPAVEIAAAPNGTVYDDFAIIDGAAYLATQTGNVIERVTRSRRGIQQVVVAGNVSTMEIYEPTSCAGGRGIDSGVLYVTTGGDSGFAAEPNAPKAIGAQLVAVELRKRSWGA